MFNEKLLSFIEDLIARVERNPIELYNTDSHDLDVVALNYTFEGSKLQFLFNTGAIDQTNFVAFSTGTTVDSGIYSSGDWFLLSLISSKLFESNTVTKQEWLQVARHRVAECKHRENTRRINITNSDVFAVIRCRETIKKEMSRLVKGSPGYELLDQMQKDLKVYVNTHQEKFNRIVVASDEKMI